MVFGEIARGLSDIKFYPLSGADVPGTGVDVPDSRNLTFGAASDSENWEGDDDVMATAFNAKTGSGSMAVGRANPTAMAAMDGGTVVISGTTPSAIHTLDETASANQVYGMIKGQANSQDATGSAYRVTIFKAKVAPAQETLALNAFNEPSRDLTFVKNATGAFIRREWFETGVAIPTTLE